MHIANTSVQNKNKSDMTGWFCLFLASLFQVAWTFSLKFLDFGKLKQADWRSLPALKESFFLLLPLLGYILFGLLNSYFLSIAMKSIPASTTIAVWLGMAVIGIKIADVAFFKERLQTGQLFYTMLIIAGVVGLKMSNRI
jgi:quaternary ammonium compound-resistance protein SugE